MVRYCEDSTNKLVDKYGTTEKAGEQSIAMRLTAKVGTMAHHARARTSSECIFNSRGPSNCIFLILQLDLRKDCAIVLEFIIGVGASGL